MIEIHNPKVKKLLKEIKNPGPYYSHCTPCKNKNLGYYKYLKEEDAIRILNMVKDENLKKNQIFNYSKENNFYISKIELIYLLFKYSFI